MNKEKKMERMLPRVKQTVDDVYAYLIPHPDGCGMVAKDFGKTNARIISSLVHRKIIEKTNLGRGEYKYKWIATMAPTPTLYRSITLEIQTKTQGYMEKYRGKQSSQNKPDKTYPLSVVADLLGSTPQPPVVPVVNELLEEKPVEKSLVDEVREMWEKMKQMGVSIQNNQLVFTEIRTTVIS